MRRFAVIGLGILGRTVARELSDRGAEVIAIDQDPELVQVVADSVALAVRLDSTNRDALLAQGIETIDAALVAIGESFHAAVLTTALLKELGVKHVISRATSEEEARILKLVQADEVIMVEEMVGRRVAQQLMSPSLLDVTELSPGMSLARVQAPAETWGKSLASVKFRQRYGLNVVAVIKPEPPEGEYKMTVLPDPNEIIEKGDTLLVDGPDQSIEQLAGLEPE